LRDVQSVQKWRNDLIGQLAFDRIPELHRAFHRSTEPFVPTKPGSFLPDTALVRCPVARAWTVAPLVETIPQGDA